MCIYIIINGLDKEPINELSLEGDKTANFQNLEVSIYSRR